jgi:hypothetical protein
MNVARWPLWLKIVTGLFVALLAISLVGNLGGNAREESYDEGYEAGVASVTPPPTPEPLPMPTPQVVNIEVPGPTVEVVPDVCVDALLKADEVIGEEASTLLEIFEAYVDFPDENLEQFGVRVETILSDSSLDPTASWDEYTALADSCLASAP